MPGGDNTGPLGQGAITGRGYGNCNDNRTFGFGFRHREGVGLKNSNRRGGGFGFHRNTRMINEELTSQQEKAVLENEIIIIKNQLSQLETRLKSIKQE